MEAELKEAQEARARLEESLQRTLASKRRVEETLRKARDPPKETATALTPEAGATAAAAHGTRVGGGARREGTHSSSVDTDERQQQEQQQSTLELELKQATSVIADLQRRLRLRRQVF